MSGNRASAEKVRPSLLWLLLAPLALVAGVGSGTAMAVSTISTVLDQALDFAPERELAAGEVTVWVDEADRPERVRLLGPGGAAPALTQDPTPSTVTADSVRWTSGHVGTITTPDRYRVDASGGRAALRGSPTLDTDTVRRNVLTRPLILAVTGTSLCLLVCIAVPVLRAVNRRRAPPGSQ